MRFWTLSARRSACSTRAGFGWIERCDRRSCRSNWSISAAFRGMSVIGSPHHTVVLAGVLGDLWNWIAGVFERIGDVSPYWLVVALALKTCESAFLGLTWRNILRAAYPKGGLSFKTAWGRHRAGRAINAIAPAQAGSAA